MRVKFEECVAGADFVYKPGREVDLVDTAEACRFVDKGIASPANADAEKAYAAYQANKKPAKPAAPKADPK